MARSFSVRGVVEGFYGRPWSPSARREVVTFLAPRGMNAYVYAPKDDEYHRGRWREPYPDAEFGELRALATHCSDHGVRMGFAVSPGLDIDYGSPGDRRTLVDKFRPLADVGVDWLLLFLDDIPMRPGLADDQAELVNHLVEHLGGDGVDVTVCPTEYLGTRPSAYLTTLASTVPESVSLMWTGPTVCSPTIGSADAASWVGAAAGRRIILWDNTPVNDATMTRELHLGPYGGRDAALCDVLAGVLCNPMVQARASLAPLATAMEFLLRPAEYDPGSAWVRAIDAVGGDRADALGVLARACATGPVAAPAALPLTQLVDALETALDGPDWPEPAVALANELRAARRLATDLAPIGPDDELAREVAPWAEAAAHEARAGLAAIRLIQGLRPPADPAIDRDSAVGPEAALALVYGLIARWTAARATTSTVYGPRFAVYSAIRQLPDGRPFLDLAESLVEDANVIDRLCRLAAADYRAWCDGSRDRSTRPGADLPFASRAEAPR